MTREEYINDIKISLGAPVVDVEIESIMGQLVDKAFREISRFITEARFITVPYANAIDVSDYKINSVMQIFRTDNPSRVGDFSDIFALGAINIGNLSSSSLLMSSYYYRTQMNQLKSTMKTDMEFTYDKAAKTLYVDSFYPPPGKITIVYIPEYKDVSDVTEMFWINYIQRLSLAFCKEALGRVRGKYNLSSSLYSLDGDTLLSEGIAERDAVREELVENSDLAFPID